MTRDILDDCMESKIRIGELCVAAGMTGFIAKLIDMGGLSDQINSAFDWFVVVLAVLWLSYCIAGSAHDVFDRIREKRYTTVYLGNRKETA